MRPMYTMVRLRRGHPRMPVPGHRYLSASVGNVYGQSDDRSPKRLVHTRETRSRMSAYSSVDWFCTNIDSLRDQDVSFGSG